MTLKPNPVPTSTWRDDIVVMSFPSVNNTQSGPNDRTVVHVDDISVMPKYYGCT